MTEPFLKTLPTHANAHLSKFRYITSNTHTDHKQMFDVCHDTADHIFNVSKGNNSVKLQMLNFGLT